MAILRNGPALPAWESDSPATPDSYSFQHSFQGIICSGLSQPEKQKAFRGKLESPIIFVGRTFWGQSSAPKSSMGRRHVFTKSRRRMWPMARGSLQKTSSTVPCINGRSQPNDTQQCRRDWSNRVRRKRRRRLIRRRYQMRWSRSERLEPSLRRQLCEDPADGSRKTAPGAKQRPSIGRSLLFLFPSVFLSVCLYSLISRFSLLL